MNITRLKELSDKVPNCALTIDYIQDPGHGWIKIPKPLGFNLDYSPFSYKDLDNLYLEEDLDASLWLDYVHKHGIKTVYNEINTDSDSYIRDLEPLL